MPSDSDYEMFWDTSSDSDISEQDKKNLEYRKIVDLLKRIDDLKTRIRWHEKSKEGDNGLSNTFNLFIESDEAKLAQLKFEFVQRRSVFEKQYGIKLNDIHKK